MKSITKLLKGLLGLFILGFTLATIGFIVESCSYENPYEENFTIDRSVQLNAFKNKVIEVGEKYKSKSLDFNAKEFQLELQIVSEIRPSALELLRSYGVTDSELIAEYGSLDDPRVAEAAMLVTATEDELLKGNTLDIFTYEDYAYTVVNTFSTPVYAQTVGGCLGEAVGINLIKDALQGGIKKLGKKGVMKLVRKLAFRTVGFVGAAVMVVEFSECMGWTNFY